mgnify:CR=1 FL=1
MTRRRASGKTGKPGGPQRRAGLARGAGPVMLYGRHAVSAALANPRRRCRRLRATESAWTARSSTIELPANLRPEIVGPDEIQAAAPPGAVAQGLLLEADPLPSLTIGDVLPPDDYAPCLFVVLDQVEDPHNVGAIMRSAAAFGAAALITQDRHSPQESGVLARSASGALDILPWVRAPNLARALAQMAERNIWRIGLDGVAYEALGRTLPGERLALVLGAEGSGLRPLTRAHCDLLAHIPMQPLSPLIDSLNVSNAAAVALYALVCRI